MEAEWGKIKNEKIKEAERLFETIGIPQEKKDEQYASEIPTFFEHSNPEKRKKPRKKRKKPSFIGQGFRSTQLAVI